uniref:L1 transposable element RRM domain-containing protein n=1 Tax=Poecilia formosa TaxID=48698 RepID=A0A096LQV1_POEFO
AMSISRYFSTQSDNMPRRKTPTVDAEENPRPQSSEANMVASTVSEGMDPALREVIREVTANLTKVIEEKLGPVSLLLQTHGKYLEDHETRIKEIETRLSAIEDDLVPSIDKLESLGKRVKDLTERADDLENRGRRKNIRIVGLPEKAEGNDPTHFFETWLPELLHIKTKTGRLKIDRAHRTPNQVPSSEPRPRPVLVRLHNFQDKQRIMNAAFQLGRNNRPLKHGSATVMIFQDFSAAVVRKRKSFDYVKKLLRAIGADYRHIYPALLKITYNGSTKVYKDASEVKD